MTERSSLYRGTTTPFSTLLARIDAAAASQASLPLVLIWTALGLILLHSPPLRGSWLSDRTREAIAPHLADESSLDRTRPIRSYLRP